MIRQSFSFDSEHMMIASQSRELEPQRMRHSVPRLLNIKLFAQLHAGLHYEDQSFHLMRSIRMALKRAESYAHSRAWERPKHHE
jgi:hypothetical protein